MTLIFMISHELISDYQLYLCHLRSILIVSLHPADFVYLV